MASASTSTPPGADKPPAGATMRTRRGRAQVLSSLALVLVAAVIVALVSCGQSSGLIRPAARCFPAALRIDPPAAQPGSTVTVESDAVACSLGYPRGHRYTITLRHR